MQATYQIDFQTQFQPYNRFSYHILRITYNSTKHPNGNYNFRLETSCEASDI